MNGIMQMELKIPVLKEELIYTEEVVEGQSLKISIFVHQICNLASW